MYDWPYIRLRYESGETAYTISKRMGGKPSKQAIMKRAAKEGWEQGQASPELPARLPIVAAALNVESRKLTDEVLQIILGMVANGSPEGIAAQAAGIHPTTLIDWKKQDPRLKDAIHRARAGKLSEWIARIDSASQKDWKAAQALLQAAPETRDQFGKTDGKGSKLEIVININREDGVTVEGEAREVDDEPEDEAA